MSTFCGGSGSVPALTPSEINELYSNGLLPDTLPAMDSGLADEKWVENYIRQLESQGKIPTPTKLSETRSTPFNAPESSDPLAQFVDKEKTLQDKSKEEYCFYEKRYFAALDLFLQGLADASLRNQPVGVQERLDLAKKLNQRVTLLTQIVNGIAKYRYYQNTQFQNDINTINKALRERQAKLLEQSKILNKENAAADVHKRMVDYTVEKNKANQNLLTLYGVLNLVAVAMIVYVARSE